MKTLFDVIKEMQEFAAPSNTMGMGDPLLPSEGQLGSEPICPNCKGKKKKKKK